MKKFFVVVSAALFAVACNNTGTESTTVDSEDTISTMNTDRDNVSVYTPDEGDISRRDGKVVVWRNNQWVEADADQRLDNGVVVYRDGRVVRDDKEMDLNEGEVVNRTGAFFDRMGQAIENAWDDTRRGVRKAGKAVGDAARKAGDKIGDAVDRDTNRQ